jgi:hypothetical protein
MDIANLPVASVPASPLTAPSQAAEPTPARKHLPLAARLSFNLTVSAKINYCDLAGTVHPPYDLRTAVILLCLAAHDNGCWYVARDADHRDGEDDPPTPLAFDLRAWHRFILDWADSHLSLAEEASLVTTAHRLWAEAHGTAVEPLPAEEGAKKKPDASPTGPSSWPTSSAEETPPAAATSSTSFPSAMPTLSSTHGSVPPGPSASPPPSPPEEMPK